VGYLERAQIIGHDVSRLQKGETLSSTVQIDSLDKFKALFAGDSTAAQRADFSKQAAALPGGAPFHDETMARLVDYVYGTGTLSAADAEASKKMFPLKVTAVSASTVTIDTDREYGPSVAPVVINAGTLIFADGSITVMNTVLSVSADTLQVNSGGAKPYHIGVLGAPGAIGTTGTVGLTAAGQAPAGRNSYPPAPGTCQGSPNGGPGSSGATGGIGGPGGPGNPGLSSLPAQIFIAEFDTSQPNKFVIFTQSGSGGQGGLGGTGGAGQQGGNGGHGCESGCEGTNGGNGGQGGTGGQGGNGGSGGNGASGSPIAIIFPQAAKSYLATTSAVAPAGAGGLPGPSGSGGAGGAAGWGGKHHSDGSAGATGADGSPGQAGPDGTVTGVPGNFNIKYT
jgi:hypothetical protein